MTNIGNRIHAFDWCQNELDLAMTLKGHYALCFKTRASFGAHHENLNEDRLCNDDVTRIDRSDNKVYADICSGSQDLCKFSLDFMLASLLRIQETTRSCRFQFQVFVHES